MKIVIHNHTTIAEIQQEFNKMFPYLKLEFFSKLHRPGQATHLKFIQPANRKLGDIRKTYQGGTITLTPDMRVNELEQVFGREYDLGVQVFRKSGESWLETILTDSWTLHEQNREGEILSTRPRPEKPDYDQDID